MDKCLICGKSNPCRGPGHPFCKPEKYRTTELRKKCKEYKLRI